MQKNNSIYPYLVLNFIILIWGFTGVLGKYIDTATSALVIYRTGLTCLSLGLYMWYKGYSFKVAPKNIFLLLLSGGVIGVHWVLFFHAIKVSNVSITLATLATGALFASILEPIFFRRRIRFYEVIFGAIAVFGVYVIFNNEHTSVQSGVLFGLAAAFVSALYSIINSKWAQKYPNDAVMISFYEMLGAAAIVALMFAPTEGFAEALIDVSVKDALAIFVLAIVCTSYTSVRIIQLMRTFSPFTILLNINLEPIYSMILAVLIFPESERMSGKFYLGAGIILSTVFLNGILSRLRDKRRRKRLLAAEQVLLQG